MKDKRAELKYPVGVQTFAELRENGYVYVDKTALIFELKNGKYYFLSRPRRFGKSLLLSTLEAYYRGRRDLFKGLALDKLTDDWDPRPVLHLDLNNGTFASPSDLNVLLDYHLKEWEKIYKIDNASDGADITLSVRFGRVIRIAYEQTGRKVVILIDEYDKPLLNTIDKPELAEVYRSQLKAFYSNLKTMDACIELAMLTGVARFSKVSIFSDLNNLRDITFENKFAAICGITSEELDSYFKPGIEELAQTKGWTFEQAREKLRVNYDGYHFSAISPDIYNPFSLLNCFAANSIGRYWFSSGTPTFLIKLLRKQGRPFKDLVPITIERNYLESAGLLSPDPVPVLYQTGYLTIKDYIEDLDCFVLDFPNEEVRRGFLDSLMRSYIPDMTSNSGFSIPEFVMAVRKGDAEDFMKRMESLIAAVPYSDKGSAESHFQNAVYLMFTLLGFFAQMEMRTSDGRIDLRVETDRYVYIFEFKVDSTASEALEQIRSKKYWQGDAVSGKEIILVGANFDTTTRRLSEWLIERK